MAFRNTSKSIGNSLTPVYTCPIGQEAVIHALYISNTDDSNDIAVDIKLNTTQPSAPGETKVDGFFVINNAKIIASTTLILDKPLNLRAGDTLSIQASANTCDCVASILTTPEVP